MQWGLLFSVSFQGKRAEDTCAKMMNKVLLGEFDLTIILYESNKGLANEFKLEKEETVSIDQNKSWDSPFLNRDESGFKFRKAAPPCCCPPSASPHTICFSSGFNVNVHGSLHSRGHFPSGYSTKHLFCPPSSASEVLVH
jgi:hypothetical protein